MNKHILLVMKWLDNKDSVSKEELIENRKSAYAADAAAAAAAAAYAYAYDAYDAYSVAAADAAAYADASAAAADASAGAANNNPEAANIRVNKYFEEIGESKQDYLEAIEVEKVGSKKEPAKEWVDGIPPLNSEVLLSDEEGHLFSSASNEKVAIAEDEVLIVVSIGARYDNGNPVVTVMAKDSKNLQGFVTVNPEFLEPVKTQEEKEREAFKQAVIDAIHKDQGTYFDRLDKVANILFNNRFKAPEEEK